jgi:hypothetical protein
MLQDSAMSPARAKEGSFVAARLIHICAVYAALKHWAMVFRGASPLPPRPIFNAYEIIEMYPVYTPGGIHADFAVLRPRWFNSNRHHEG